MLLRVKRTIADHDLLTEGDGVLVGLSGGPDSVALLHLLTRMRRSMRLEIQAVYLNHGIRKRAARREEIFCRELCERLKVPCEIVTEDVPALARRQKKGLEEAARDLRFKVLGNIADERGLNKIALGHHADDQVETILFRFARGTGRSGLLGIPHSRDRIVRPLLDLRKSELLAYLKRHRLAFCTDHTNLDSKYRRNYIRNKLLPALRKNLNPSVDQAILNLADSLEAEESFLERLRAEAARNCLSATAGGKLELDLRRFSSYDKWLRRRLLRYCLKVTCPESPAPDKRTVEGLDQLARSDTGAVSLPGRLRAIVVGPKMVFHRTPAIRFRKSLEPGERLRLSKLSVNFSSRLKERGQIRLIKRPRAKKVFLDWEKIRPPLEVRSLRAGDRFRPLGMTGHKKVGDYLTDRKTPEVYRDEIPVVCDTKGIIWLVGFELADRVKIDEYTKKVLTIAYTVRRKEILAAV